MLVSTLGWQKRKDTIRCTAAGFFEHDWPAAKKKLLFSRCTQALWRAFFSLRSCICSVSSSFQCLSNSFKRRIDSLPLWRGSNVSHPQCTILFGHDVELQPSLYPNIVNIHVLHKSKYVLAHAQLLLIFALATLALLDTLPIQHVNINDVRLASYSTTVVSICASHALLFVTMRLRVISLCTSYTKGVRSCWLGTSMTIPG